MWSPFFYYDMSFLAFMLPALIFSLVCQGMVKSAYKKQARVQNARRMTGFEAAQRVLRHYGITDVRIEMTRGKLSDHYDPRSRTIRLSEGVYNNPSVAAVGIAAHEAGHAAQHAEAYIPIKLRNGIFPLVRVGSFLAFPLIMIGYIIDSFDASFLITLGLGLFALTALFQLITLPIEFNASRRALRVIEAEDLLYEDELRGAKKVLRAAALTYVAALVVTLMNLLRLLMRFGRRR